MPLLLLRHQLKWRRSNYKITLFVRIQKILPWQLRHQMRQHPWHSWRWCSPPRVSTRVQVFCPNPTCRIPVLFSNLSYTELSQTCHLFQFLQCKNYINVLSICKNRNPGSFIDNDLWLMIATPRRFKPVWDDWMVGIVQISRVPCPYTYTNNMSVWFLLWPDLRSNNHHQQCALRDQCYKLMGPLYVIVITVQLLLNKLVSRSNTAGKTGCQKSTKRVWK